MNILPPLSSLCLSFILVSCTTIQITQDMYQSHENRQSQNLPSATPLPPGEAAKIEKVPDAMTPRLGVYDPTFSVFAAGGSASDFALDLKLSGKYFGVGVEGFVTESTSQNSYDQPYSTSFVVSQESWGRSRKLYGGLTSGFVRLPIEGNGHRVTLRFGAGYGLFNSAGFQHNVQGVHYLAGIEIRTTLIWLDGDIILGATPRLRLGGGFDLSNMLAIGAQYVVREGNSSTDDFSHLMAVLGLRF